MSEPREVGIERALASLKSKPELMRKVATSVSYDPCTSDEDRKAAYMKTEQLARGALAR